MTSTKKHAVPATAGASLPMACVGCHAMLHDTAPADYFDRLQEQSRVQYRTNCQARPPGAKPCQQAQAQTTAAQPISASQLVFYTDEITTKLRDALGAYEGLEYTVSCSADHALPQPERLGAIIRAINEATASQLVALEQTLASLRATIKAAPAAGRV